MDRIRKALDLARLERLQADRSPAPPTHKEEHAAAPADSFEPPGAARADADPSAPIVYTRSKTFIPSPAHLENHRIMNPGDTGAVAAAYRMLRTQVLQRLDANGWRSLAIFSPRADDGKTTTAINLAVSLSSDRLHTVLLVEFDFKRPTLAASLGFKPEYGADDALAGRADPADCLYHPDGFDRLVLMPAREPMGNSSEVLAGPRSRLLVAALRARYPERIIIVDLPPVLQADDALAFAPLVECGLVVAAEGRTRRVELMRTIELLSKTPLVGTVLNRATDARFEY